MNIIFKEETASTNDDAKQLAANGAEEWTAVCAKRQLSGRGRTGKSFYSPKGGLYISFILRPKFDGEIITLLTTAAAAAMSRAIDTVFSVHTKIKWVNDIYLDGLKVCGILTEAAFSGSQLDYAVVGIGVNLFGQRVPQELEGIMGFISDTESDGRELTDAFFRFFGEYYARLFEKPHLEYYRQKQFIENMSVTVLQNGSFCEAFALGIDENFHLRTLSDGKEKALSFGEVSIRL